MADPREDRLPKWAQEELNMLRRELDRERLLNADLRADVGETNTVVEHYTAEDQPLRQDARVKFQLGTGRWDQYVTVHADGDRLWLHGGSTLTIHPQVSNAFYVTVGR